MFIILFLTASLGSAFCFGSEVELSGRIIGTGQIFFSEPEQSPPDMQRSSGRLRTEPAVQIVFDNSRARMKLIAGYDFTYPQFEDASLLIPQEAFYEQHQGAWTLRAGMNTFNWGVTDIVNPLDVINPRSFRDPFAPDKIGSFALNAAWSGELTSVEFVYIPRQLPHQLPPVQSRYVPRDISLSTYANEFYRLGAVPLFPNEPLRLKFGKIEEYDHPFDHNFAFRARRTWGALEAHLIAFEGMPTYPDINVVADFDIVGGLSVLRMRPDVNLIPQYQRVRIWGAGLVYSADRYIFRLAHGETFRTSRGAEIELPVTTVAAIERTHSVSGWDLNFLVQAAIQRDNSSQPRSIFSTQSLFDQSWMPGFRVARGLDFSLMLGSIMDFDDHGYALMLESQYRINERLQGKFSLQQIDGLSATILGSLKPTSNAELGLMYYW